MNRYMKCGIGIVFGRMLVRGVLVVSGLLWLSVIGLVLTGALVPALVLSVGAYSVHAWCVRLLWMR